MNAYTESPSANREKQPELTELHIKLMESGERLEKCLSRLTTIGNKLADDGVQDKALNEPRAEPSPRLPGLVSDLCRDADGFRSLINSIESQLSKIESQV